MSAHAFALVMLGWKMRTVVLVLACIAFLIAAFAVWLASGRSWLVWAAVLIPSWICADYLSAKIFSAAHGRSISDRDFSIARILYGVVLGGLLVGGIYGLGWALYLWLF